ncbi:MAG: hypothetical protein FWD71_15630 [Oscillospiraceae bacterium]|nr:hypothetical protein [Oscillospiraceae bacterium]
MSEVINLLKKQLEVHGLHFTKKPILIGGMAMEYYGLRKSGTDIDLVICDKDYQALALAYPDSRKDLWADLGVTIEPLEIWRSIKLLDYDFYLIDAIDEEIAYVVSLDRLALMRVFAMGVPKYMEDLKLIKDYYYRTIHNPDFKKVQDKHFSLYESNGGVVWGGKYTD